MTCIVGVEHGGKVTIGGDSAGVAGHALRVRADEKVWERDGFTFGFTGSFRMGQLLRFSLALPDSRYAVRSSDEAAYRWLCTDFIDAVREFLKQGGYLTNRSGEESGGTFLMGWRGRLYYVGGDFQVGRAESGFDAVGSGAQHALGALHALASLPRPPAAANRVTAALEASAGLTSSVRGPFRTVTV